MADGYFSMPHRPFHDLSRSEASTYAFIGSDKSAMIISVDARGKTVIMKQNPDGSIKSIDLKTGCDAAWSGFLTPAPA